MSFLVQDFLDYSQIKSGNFRKNIKGFNIRKTIEKVMSIQRRKAESLKLNFFASFENIGKQNTPIQKDGRHSPIVFTDEQRVMQVLLNLQSNALKFTQNGEVRLLVRIVDEGSKKLLKIKVADTGVGIAKSD
mmetsp:Transcript_1030/g.1236  ORF Transcript_1030/g.1236 Transcript_1030/m.1236 type:complete len:132 (+) Transcript_1030:795-1190(+)